MIYTGIGGAGKIEQIKAHGGHEIAAVYGSIGGQQLLYSKETIMPHMDGITNYYDCKKGLTSSSWANQVSNANHAVLTGATITQDGDLQVLCTEASHGYFTAGISHGGSNSMCMYTIFKSTSVGRINQNRHVVGSCYGSLSSYVAGGWFSAAIDGYRTADTIGADLWGIGCGSSVYCDSYHVVVVNKLYRQGQTHPYQVSLYIDGVFISESSIIDPSTGVKFGIGGLCDQNYTFGGNDRDLPVQIKMIAVGGESHSAAQIAENSAWLRSYYGLGS